MHSQGPVALGSYDLYEHKKIVHKRAALALGPKFIRGGSALALAGGAAQASAPIPYGYYPETAIFYHAPRPRLGGKRNFWAPGLSPGARGGAPPRGLAGGK